MPPPDRRRPSSAEPVARPPRDPNVALLLTWFIPGLGHLYLRRARTALVGFLVVQGLYGLGLWFSHGMFLEYLPLEMRGRFAGILTPEAGNLGALLYHMKHFGYGALTPRQWPAMMDVGTALTALSGVTNLFLMALAHLDARLPRRPGER